jgi:hypothetical protein
MTATAKHIGSSLKNIVDSDAMQRILDRSEPVSDVVETILDHYQYDLYSRKPKPALLENGALQPTENCSKCKGTGVGAGAFFAHVSCSDCSGKGKIHKPILIEVEVVEEKS